MKYAFKIKREVWGKIEVEADNEKVASYLAYNAPADDVSWDDYSEDWEVFSLTTQTKDCNNGYR